MTKGSTLHEHIGETREAIATRLQAGDYSSYPNNYGLGGLQGIPKYFRDYSTVLTLGRTGNLAVTYLGSYGLRYYVVSVDTSTGTALVLFHADNWSTRGSALRPPFFGYTPIWQTYVEPVIDNPAILFNNVFNQFGIPFHFDFSGGPGSRTSQDFWWYEIINFK